MIDKNSLGICKRIYYFYYSLNGESSHIEKRNVIYINKKYIYIKEPGTLSLKRLHISMIRDNLTNLLHSVENGGHFLTGYYFIDYNELYHEKGLISSIKEAIAKNIKSE